MARAARVDTQSILCALSTDLYEPCLTHHETTSAHVLFRSSLLLLYCVRLTELFFYSAFVVEIAEKLEA